MQLTKAYGIAPIVISALVSAFSLSFLVFVAMPAETITLQQIGISNEVLLECNRTAVNVLWSLHAIYKHVSIALIMISIIVGGLFWVYDKPALIFHLIICTIFIGPFLAILDENVIVISPTSVVRICRSDFQSNMLFVQYFILFVSNYFLVGNAFLFYRRNIGDKGLR